MMFHRHRMDAMLLRQPHLHFRDFLCRIRRYADWDRQGSAAGCRGVAMSYLSGRACDETW